MTLRLLADYARLLTYDTDACAELFAADALYTTLLGGQEVRLEGRSAIRDFLVHVPRQLHFRAESCSREGPEFLGSILVEGTHFQRVRRPVRYRVEEGRFRTFEMMPDPGTSNGLGGSSGGNGLG